jgi:hypothetical protein
MWIITAPVSGQMGRVNTTEMSDDWNIVHNIDIDYAIVEVVHQWNVAIQNQYKEKNIDELVVEDLIIHDWNSFELHLMNGDLDDFIPNGIKLPPFRIVDMHEVRRYLPKWKASHFAGYINSEINKRMKDKAGDMQENFKWALLCAAVILVAAILAYIILHGA